MLVDDVCLIVGLETAINKKKRKSLWSDLYFGG